MPVAPSATFAAGGAPGVRTPSVIAGAAAAFPDSMVRHVFAWDSMAAAYRLTSDTSGPAAGIRFLLYREYLGQVLSPITSIGRFDLIDVSGGGSAALHAGIADSLGAGADYGILPIGTQSAYSALLVGTISGGPRTLQLRDSTTRSGSSVTVDGVVDDAAGGVHVTVHVNRTAIDAFDNFYNLQVKLSHGADTVGIKGSIDTYCLVSSTGATVTVNGGIFALITNDQHGLVFTREDGQPVTPAQQQAMVDLLGLQGRLFQQLDALFTPVRPWLSP